MTEDEEQREYHRNQAQQLRETWKDAGCGQLTIVAPQETHAYLRGLSNCMSASHVLKQILGGDEQLLATIAQRRPKYSVKMEDVEMIRRPDIDDRCDYMMDILREGRKHKAEGKAMLTTPRGPYHYAVEWCLNHYLRGYFDMTLYYLKGYDKVEEPLIELAELWKRGPNVLQTIA